MGKKEKICSTCKNGITSKEKPCDEKFCPNYGGEKFSLKDDLKDGMADIAFDAAVQLSGKEEEIYGESSENNLGSEIADEVKETGCGCLWGFFKGILKGIWWLITLPLKIIAFFDGD